MDRHWTIAHFALLPLLWWPAAVAAQDTAGVGAIRGTVTAAGAPAADVAICVPALSRCEVSDRSGAFLIADLRPDSYDVEIVAAGSPPLVSPVTVRAGLDTVLEVVLPEPAAIEETITVSAPAFVAGEEVKTSGFLSAATEIARGAGALQDVSRFVQTLPGAVIGTDDFRNDLIVRGGSPLENLYIVDNIEIPNINTFANSASAGGTVSMIDAQLLQDVTFLSGGFPAAYGNRTSSVLQIALREGNRERPAARATFGFAGAGAVAEGPLASGRGSWIASARRSVLDLVTNDTGIGGVPVLYTLNGKLVFDATPRDRIWLLNVSGFDRIRLGATADADLTSELANLDITYRGARHATGLNWQRTFGARGVGLLGATYSRASVRQRIGDLIRNGVPDASQPIEDQIANAAEVFRERSTESDLAFKYDLTVYAGSFGKVQAGASLKRSVTDYDAASPFGNEGPFFLAPEANPFVLQERKATNHASGYAQVSKRLAGRVAITAGLRADRYGYLPASRLSPRLGASIDLSETVSLRIGGGRYYQQPFLLFVTAFPANRALEPFRADHAVAGIHVTPDRQTRVTVEAYWKRYGGYPVSVDVPQLSLANVGDTFAVREILFPMVSEGRGDAIGLEFFAERKPGDGSPWYGQVNAAVSRSRYAGRDQVLRPGSFDYPFAVNLVGGRALNRSWDVAVRVSALGGRPYTPIDEARSAAARRPIYDLSAVNGVRGPAYFRADLRVDRRWTINGQPVSVFFGAQNITNRKNLAGFSWDRRNGGIKRLEQLGLFPILGLDWQF